MQAIQWIKDMNKHFTEENYQITNKCVKQYWTQVGIREIQIKIMMRYQYIPIRTVKRKHSDNTKSCLGWKETGSLVHSHWDCTMVQPFWKTVWELFKIYIHLIHDPVIPEKWQCMTTQKLIRDHSHQLYSSQSWPGNNQSDSQ